MIALSLRRDVGPFLCCDKNITITTKAAYMRNRFVVLVFVVAQLHWTVAMSSLQVIFWPLQGSFHFFSFLLELVLLPCVLSSRKLLFPLAVFLGCVRWESKPGITIPL